MKTLITWPHGSADGERAGTHLHEKFAGGSRGVSSKDLETIRNERFALLIVVGPHDDIDATETLDAVIYNANVLEIPHIALAGFGPVHSGSEPAESSDLWAAAQHVADEMGAAVLAPRHGFTFDDIALAKVFVGDERGVDVINPDGVQVWKEFRRGEREEPTGEAASHT